MWNPIKNNRRFKENISILKALGYSLHSFDREDCRKYGMIFHNSFYNFSAPINQLGIKYDFYFLGAAKDRTERINEVKRFLKEFNNLFIMPSEPSGFISYQQNIENIQSSKCIVEVLQNQQHDITLRPLEAIVFKRKLLTNNLAIRDYPFYNPTNVFLFGEDDPDSLDQFLNSPFQEIPEGVMTQYDVNTWIDSF